METDNSKIPVEERVGFISQDEAKPVRGSDRETWGGQLESTLTLIGYSVGFANIWRFPYLCYRNGGGVFVFLFVIFMITCGLPLFYMEVLLGQFSGKSPFHVWDICPLLRGIGLVMIFVSGSFVWYYSMMVGWVYYYFFQSFYPTLGWTTCGNSWNTPQCTEELGPKTTFNYTLVQNSRNENTSSTYGNVTYDVTKTERTAALEFWENNVLTLSSGIHDMGSPQWHLVGCLFLSWFIAFLCLVKGVKSVGKVVYFTVIAPYILLTVLLIRGATLEGAWTGLKVYLYPDFTKLGDIQIWIAVIFQVFYTLGNAWGSVITMASYNKFNQNALRESIIVCTVDAFTCVFSGLPVFAILGYLSEATGKPLEQFQSSGPGLVFIAYPEALSRLPMPNVWSVLFFATLIFLAIDSLFSTFEAVSTSIVDAYHGKLHKYKTVIVGVIMLVYFVAGIPLATSGGYYIILLMDWYSGTINVVIAALFEVFVVSWIYGANRFAGDAEMMLGKKPSLLVRLTWCFGLPAFILAVNILMIINFSEPTYGDSGYKFPPTAIVIGKLLAMAPLLAIPIYAVIQILFEKGSLKQRLVKLTKPSQRWGPNDAKAKIIYTQYPYKYEESLCSRLLVNTLGIPTGMADRQVDEHLQLY